MNKKFLVLVSAFLVLGLLPYARKAMADESGFEKFRSGVATKERLLSTLQLKFLVSTFPIVGREKSVLSDVSAYVWITDGIRWRSDQYALIDNGEVQMSSFDGEQYYDYRVKSKSAVVSDELNSDNIYTRSLDYILLSWGRDKMSELLARLKVVKHERVVIEGRNYDKYIAVNDRPAYRDYYSFLVEGNLNILEVQFINYKKGASSSRGYILHVNASEAIADGYTLPTSVQKESFVLSKGKEPALQWFQNFKVVKLIYDEDAPDEVFELPIPTGTLLFYGDGVTPATRVISEPTPTKDVSGEFFSKIEQDKSKIEKEEASQSVIPKWSFDPQVVPDFP